MPDNHHTTKTPSTKRAPDASWTPVFYSIVVFPGIGQWLQRRYNAGLFYAAVFALLGFAFAIVLWNYLAVVVPILRDALAGADLTDRTIPPLRQILNPFYAVLFVYVANTIDVLRGRQNLRRALRPG
jgi:hypothetical protein